MALYVELCKEINFRDIVNARHYINMKGNWYLVKVPYRINPMKRDVLYEGLYNNLIPDIDDDYYVLENTYQEGYFNYRDYYFHLLKGEKLEGLVSDSGTGCLYRTIKLEHITDFLYKLAFVVAKLRNYISMKEIWNGGYRI